MPEEFKPGCKRPPIKKVQQASEAASPELNTKEANPPMIKVGSPAPNFTASAYLAGKFVNLSLEEFKGKWVLLCFYPGDFTFV